jgi:hypothetical protein
MQSCLTSATQFYLKFQLHEKLPSLVLSNDEWASIAGACLSIELMRRPFLLRAPGRLNFAVREWVHKSTFVAGHGLSSLPSGCHDLACPVAYSALFFAIALPRGRQVHCSAWHKDGLPSIRVYCDTYPCCFHACRTPLFVAVDLLWLPLSLCDDADGARTWRQPFCTSASWWHPIQQYSSTTCFCLPWLDAWLQVSLPVSLLNCSPKTPRMKGL